MEATIDMFLAEQRADIETRNRSDGERKSYDKEYIRDDKEYSRDREMRERKRDRDRDRSRDRRDDSRRNDRRHDRRDSRDQDRRDREWDSDSFSNGRDNHDRDRRTGDYRQRDRERDRYSPPYSNGYRRADYDSYSDDDSEPRVPGLDGPRSMDRWSDGSNGMDRSAERWISNVCTNTIILRGLPSSIEANDIRDEMLKNAIPAKDIRLMKRKDSGVSRGFAFVEFQSTEEARRWMEHNQVKSSSLIGRPTQVTRVQ